MNNYRLSLLALIFSMACLTSCTSTKKTNILQGNTFKEGEMTLVTNKAPVYRLQPNDVLSIRIKSLDQDQVEYLSLEAEGVFNVSPASSFMNGYSVSDSGYITMPGIGKVKVGNLTVSEARSKIQDRVRQTEVGDATIFVNLVSFKVSVVGEVKRPDQYYVFNNQATLMEAISMAGGFEEFADRGQVQLLRQTARGTEGTIIDFMDADILSSPFFYLQPNDMLVVNSMEEKHQRGNLSTLVVINTLVSGISATIAIVTLIRTNNQQEE